MPQNQINILQTLVENNGSVFSRYSLFEICYIKSMEIKTINKMVKQNSAIDQTKKVCGGTRGMTEINR